MRIVLGRLHAIKLLNIRHELTIPHVSVQITEINVLIYIKMFMRIHSNPSTDALQAFFIKSQHPSKWATKTAPELRLYRVHDLYQERHRRYFPGSWVMRLFPNYSPFPPKKIKSNYFGILINTKIIDKYYYLTSFGFVNFAKYLSYLTRISINNLGILCYVILSLCVLFDFQYIFYLSTINILTFATLLYIQCVLCKLQSC